MASIQGFTATQNAVLANVQIGDLVYVQKVEPQYDDESDSESDYDEDEEGNEQPEDAEGGDDDIESEAGSDDEEGEDTSLETVDTSNTSVSETFAPTMFVVTAMTKDGNSAITDLRVAQVTYSDKADEESGEHTFQIYGKEVITHHSNTCSCEHAQNITNIAVDEHFVFQHKPTGDEIRRHIATNPSRRCIAKCREGWLNHIQDLDNMIKDYDVPLLSWQDGADGALPGFLMKVVCPVCVGPSLTKEQQDTQLMLLEIGTENAQALFGTIHEFIGRLNPRRRELGYSFYQFDERSWGHGAFDDMLTESDEEDTSGQFEHWEEAMDPGANAVLRPASDATIAALPRSTFGEAKQDGDADTCMICADDMKTDSPTVVLPCGHAAFDEECIIKWLKQYDNCPKCRTRVPPEGPEGDEEAKAIPVAPMRPLSPGDSGDDFSVINGAGMSGEAAMAAAIAASLAEAQTGRNQGDWDGVDAIMSDE